MHPEPTPQTPAPIKNIELNLDVILTHILHELNPPEVPSDPHELIENLVSPIVIQLLNNDVVPAMPTCTWPGVGGTATVEETDNGIQILPKTDEVIHEVLEQVLDELDLPDSVDKEQLIEDSMPSEEDAAQINLQSEDGLEEVDVIVTGLEKHVQQVLDGEVVEDDSEVPESVADLADQLSTDLEDDGISGVDELDLQEVVDEAM